MSRPAALRIRLSRPSDTVALARLARINNTQAPAGRALIAERHGVAVAALAVTSGAVVTDPARRGDETSPLMRLRRYRLVRGGGEARRLSSRTGHAVPAGA